MPVNADEVGGGVGIVEGDSHGGWSARLVPEAVHGQPVELLAFARVDPNGNLAFSVPEAAARRQSGSTTSAAPSTGATSRLSASENG